MYYWRSYRIFESYSLRISDISGRNVWRNLKRFSERNPRKICQLIANRFLKIFFVEISEEIPGGYFYTRSNSWRLFYEETNAMFSKIFSGGFSKQIFKRSKWFYGRISEKNWWFFNGKFKKFPEKPVEEFLKKSPKEFLVQSILNVLTSSLFL